jgi:hypothetical protein
MKYAWENERGEQKNEREISGMMENQIFMIAKYSSLIFN